MKQIRALFLALVAVLAAPLAFAAVPPPIPALPDTSRLTTYTPTASTGPFNVSFDVYGDGTDYGNWIEVWVNGTKMTAVTDWQLTSPSGALNLIPRPVTDAQITLTAAATGTVQIVGARRPRRVSQFSVQPAVRDFNQVLTDLTAQNREIWDLLQNRTIKLSPGAMLGSGPSAASCAGKYIGFDGTGLIPTCTPGGAGSGNVVGPEISVIGNIPSFANTTGNLLGPGYTPAQLAALISVQQPGTGAISRTLANKFAETVSVADFGAKCDGSTDDTASFQYALNSATTYTQQIRVPSGICVLSSRLSLSLVAGTHKSLKITGDGQDSTTLRWTAGSGGFLFTLNNAGQVYAANRVDVSDLTISTTVFQSNPAIQVIGGSGGTDNSAGPMFQNITVKGDNGTGYWTIGVYVIDASRSTFDNYFYLGTVVGSYTEANMRGTAVRYSGNGDHFISNSHFTNFDKAVVMESLMEGVYITNTAMVAGNWCVFANSTDFASRVTFINWTTGHCNTYSGVVHAGWANWLYFSNILSLQLNAGAPVGPYIGYDIAGENVNSAVPGRSINFVNNTVNMMPSAFSVTGYKFRGLWGVAVTGGSIEGTATNTSSYTPYGTGIDIDGSAAIAISGTTSRGMDTFAKIGPASNNITVSGSTIAAGNTGVSITGSVSSRAGNISISGNSFSQMATRSIALDSCNICVITGNVDSSSSTNGSWTTAGTNASKGSYSFGNNWWSPSAQVGFDASSQYYYSNELNLQPNVALALIPKSGQAVTTVGGRHDFLGTTSGTVSIKTQAAAGTYNFNLPITAGSAGQVMRSQGGSATAMDWLTLAAVASSGSATDLTAGTLPAARLPNPTVSTLGGIQSLTCAANQWLNTISTAGVPACAQPAFSNLSGSLASTQLATTTITALTNKATPDPANDYVVIYDNAGVAVKKSTVGAVGAAGAAGVTSIDAKTGAITLGNGLQTSLNVLAVDQTAWTTFTPTVGVIGGSVTTGTVAGAYKLMGKSLAVRYSVQVTGGASPSALTLQLPGSFTANGNQAFAVARADDLNSSAKVSSGASTIVLIKYDGTGAVATTTYYVNGVVEVN